MGGFDFSTAWLGAGVFGAVAALWFLATWRVRPTAAALMVGGAHLVVAALHATAPFAAFMADYPGYAFGFLSGPGGSLTAALTAAIFALAVIGAFNAIADDRRARWRVTATSAFFTVNLGGALTYRVVTDLGGQALWLGDGLIIPAPLGAGLLFALAVIPFLVGAIWAGRRALSPPV